MVGRFSKSMIFPWINYKQCMDCGRRVSIDAKVCGLCQCENLSGRKIDFWRWVCVSIIGTVVFSFAGYLVF